MARDDDDQAEMDRDVAAALRLVAALVLQAVKDYHADIRRHGHDVARRMEPATYLHDDSPRALGMRWCCYLLRLSPKHIRQQAHTPACMDVLRRAFVVGYAGRNIQSKRQRLAWKRRQDARR